MKREATHPRHALHTEHDRIAGIDPILRMPELVKVTGLSKASIYRMVADGDFPRPVQLGKQAVGWRASAVQRWNESLQEVPLGGVPWSGRAEPAPTSETSAPGRSSSSARR